MVLSLIRRKIVCWAQKSILDEVWNATVSHESPKTWYPNKWCDLIKNFILWVKKYNFGQMTFRFKLPCKLLVKCIFRFSVKHSLVNNFSVKHFSVKWPKPHLFEYRFVTVSCFLNYFPYLFVSEIYHFVSFRPGFKLQSRLMFSRVAFFCICFLVDRLPCYC
jgi:hypothetical protein